jgi:hypothetical protein
LNESHTTWYFFTISGSGSMPSPGAWGAVM